MQQPLADGHSLMPNGSVDPAALAVLLRDLARETGCDLPEDFSVEGPLSIRPQSVVYRLKQSGGARSLAVKQYVDSPLGGPDRDAAVRQFADLSRCYAAMQENADFRVPEPVGDFSDAAIILMEWIDGPSFLDALCRRWSSARSLTPLSRLAGAWLRAFHDAGSASMSVCCTADLDQEIERARIAMEREKVALALANHAFEALVAYRSAVAGRPVLRTWLHGDFQPGNVIFGPKAVYGIDIAYSTRGVALADVAHFLNHVRRMAYLPSGLHLVASYRRILDDFVLGYSGAQDVIDPLVLCWYRLLDDLRFLTRYYPHIRTGMHRWYFLHLQRVAIAQYVAMLRRLAPQTAPGE